MVRLLTVYYALEVAILAKVKACADEDWFGATSPAFLGEHGNKFFKRLQWDAKLAPETRPEPLHWGQINFLSTTDTHGWLAGHVLDPNYSSDFGDFSSFVQHMKKEADRRGVDLLLIDSGDLHDGTGLSGTTDPDALLTNPIFEKLPYDVLSIGNHELYKSNIALDTYHNFAPYWHGNYLTSNVEIYDDITGDLVSFSEKYRYFTTKHGLRIMSFGFLFNFTGNSNQTIVTPVGVVVEQTWFRQLIDRTDIDLFVLAGHIPVRSSEEWSIIYRAIRKAHPYTPIAIFGGHLHIRDFVVYDASAVAISAGRYCETIGWMSLDGLNHTSATVPSASGAKITTFTPVVNSTPVLESTMMVTRQYLDFNQVTFEYHTNTTNDTFATPKGQDISRKLTELRIERNLTTLFGCAPASYFLNRYPVSHERSLFHYLTNVVFPATVFAPNRKGKPRIMLTNTGVFRYDLLEGQFTLDQAYQINPYTNVWVYMTVPWRSAKNLLSSLQKDRKYKRTEQYPAKLTDGYVTKDDLGLDGDNTRHNAIEVYPPPHYVQGNASFPTQVSDEMMVDVYVTDYFSDAAAKYLNDNSTDWIVAEAGFTSFQVLTRMAERSWSRDC